MPVTKRQLKRRISSRFPIIKGKNISTSSFSLFVAASVWYESIAKYCDWNSDETIGNTAVAERRKIHNTDDTRISEDYIALSRTYKPVRTRNRQGKRAYITPSPTHGGTGCPARRVCITFDIYKKKWSVIDTARVGFRYANRVILFLGCVTNTV